MGGRVNKEMEKTPGWRVVGLIRGRGLRLCAYSLMVLASTVALVGLAAALFISMSMTSLLATFFVGGAGFILTAISVTILMAAGQLLLHLIRVEETLAELSVVLKRTEGD